MRSALKHIWLILFLYPHLILAQVASLSQNVFPRDGKLRLFVYHTGQFVEFNYLDAKGDWDPNVYANINALLRSYTDDKTHAMDVRLIELADHLQDHFAVDTIEVISGFRSPDYNRQLKAEGHAVANESFHTLGMALDIHIDEIDEKVLRDYLRQLGLGGVGYYAQKLMVHMDFGPVREWNEAKFIENVSVGLFNKTVALALTSERFYYHDGDHLQFRFSGFAVRAGAVHVTLQQFHRGVWLDVMCADDICASQILPTASAGTFKIDLAGWRARTEKKYGKFRLRATVGDLWQNSNEFYVKRANP